MFGDKYLMASGVDVISTVHSSAWYLKTKVRTRTYANLTEVQSKSGLQPEPNAGFGLWFRLFGRVRTGPKTNAKFGFKFGGNFRYSFLISNIAKNDMTQYFITLHIVSCHYHDALYSNYWVFY